MAADIIERRSVRFHKVGGSRSIVVPEEWLERQQIGDEADIVLTSDAILIERHVEPAPSIEDEPEFVTFMNFLLADALSHPQALVDPTGLLSQANDLIDGADTD